MAGIDVELPSVKAFGGPLLAALADGVVDEKVVDRALSRVLQQKCELGLLDEGWAPLEPADVDLDGPESRALALELARRSLVLLANDGILPLAEQATGLAVVGEFARTPRYQGAGSSQVTPTRLDVLLDELRGRYGEVAFAPGYRIEATNANAHKNAGEDQSGDCGGFFRRCRHQRCAGLSGRTKRSRPVKSR